MIKYSEKLKDPRWQRKRLLILDRDNWKCTACRSSTKTLHVHHLIYTGTDPWDTPNEHLETLCCDCHDWREFFNDIFGRSTVTTRSCCAFVRFYSPVFSGEINQGIKDMKELYEICEDYFIPKSNPTLWPPPDI
jgi:hypothetical protein